GKSKARALRPGKNHGGHKGRPGARSESGRPPKGFQGAAKNPIRGPGDDAPARGGAGNRSGGNTPPRTTPAAGPDRMDRGPLPSSGRPYPARGEDKGPGRGPKPAGSPGSGSSRPDRGGRARGSEDPEAKKPWAGKPRHYPEKKRPIAFPSRPAGNYAGKPSHGKALGFAKPSKAELGKLMARYGVPLPPHTLDLLWAYHQLLRENNADQDLTRLIGFDTVAQRHYADCMSLHGMMKGKWPSPLVDVGSGAGFPGLMIKLMSPSTRIVL